MSVGDQTGITSGRVAAALAVGAMGGALGAAMLWIGIGRMGLSGASIGLILTAVGWFISARLSERNQTRLFQHNIINTARLELTAQIREEQRPGGPQTRVDDRPSTTFVRAAP